VRELSFSKDLISDFSCAGLVCSQNNTSEQLIGEWMELRGNRDQMVIATKVSVSIFVEHIECLTFLVV